MGSSELYPGAVEGDILDIIFMNCTRVKQKKEVENEANDECLDLGS